ncbi:hypothetical protein JCM9279_001254 [Rhodotorula babjevae]
MTTFRQLVALWSILLALANAQTKKNRKITVANQCTFTVWPGLFTSVGPLPSQDTGWEAKSGTSLTFEVEESWGGRVWPRTGCDFSDTSKPDYDQCETGGCIGGLQCNATTGTGRLPVTLAEFNIQTEVDHYDTSNVDGYNVGLSITNSADCPLSNCPYDLLAACPDDLKRKNAAGDVVGCLTACGAWEDNEEYCCKGAHATPETCPSSNIIHYDWWKDACPIAYAYAYDESSGTALFTCTKQVDWTITFCPDASLFDTSVTLPNGTTVTQGGEYKLFDTVKITGESGGDSGGGSGGAASSSGGGAAASAGGGGGGTSSTGGGAGSSGDSTKAATGASSKTASSAAAGATGANAGSDSGSSGASGASGASSGSSSSSSSSELTSGDDDTILGMPKMAAWAILGVVVLLIVGAVGYFVWSSNKKGAAKKRRQQSSDDSPSTDDGSSTGSGGDDDDVKAHKKRHGRHRDDDEDYSLAKLDALGIAERRAVEDSIYSAAARNPLGLRGALAEQGRATFELAKNPMSSGGSDSEAGQQLLRSRRGVRAFDDRRL